jgi:hypothetical protein
MLVPRVAESREPTSPQAVVVLRVVYALARWREML